MVVNICDGRFIYAIMSVLYSREVPQWSVLYLTAGRKSTSSLACADGLQAHHSTLTGPERSYFARPFSQCGGGGTAVDELMNGFSILS